MARQPGYFDVHEVGYDREGLGHRLRRDDAIRHRVAGSRQQPRVGPHELGEHVDGMVVQGGDDVGAVVTAGTTANLLHRRDLSVKVGEGDRVVRKQRNLGGYGDGVASKLSGPTLAVEAFERHA